jgi:hypothetical protein
MIALIIEFALFFLVLFFVMPSLFIFMMILRELIHQQRKLTGSPSKWRRSNVSEVVG